MMTSNGPNVSNDVESHMRTREEAHRRAVLLGMAALIVFSTSPVFGHHLASQADALLGGRDHLLRVCLVALHLLLQPVHLVFHFLLAGGLAYATWDRLQASRRLNSVLRLLEWEAPTRGSMIHQAAAETGLPMDRVRVVHGLPIPAFTAGFWTPRVYVARSLAEILDAEQLVAVFAHEKAHLRRRDPLRLSTLRFLACTLFYLPALRRLADDAADEAEIAADDESSGHSSSGRRPVVLASALVEIAQRWPALDAPGAPLPVAGVVGAPGTDLLERRVRRLLGEDVVVETHVTRGSLAGAGAILATVWLSGLVMAHPLPLDVAADRGFMGLQLSGASVGSHGAVPHGSHCDHYGAFALTHLFCLGRTAHEAGKPCPHERVASPAPVVPA